MSLKPNEGCEDKVNKIIDDMATWWDYFSEKGASPLVSFSISLTENEYKDITTTINEMVLTPNNCRNILLEMSKYKEAASYDNSSYKITAMLQGPCEVTSYNVKYRINNMLVVAHSVVENPFSLITTNYDNVQTTNSASGDSTSSCPSASTSVKSDPTASTSSASVPIKVVESYFKG